MIFLGFDESKHITAAVHACTDSYMYVYVHVLVCTCTCIIMQGTSYNASNGYVVWSSSVYHYTRKRRFDVICLDCGRF